MIIKIQKEFVKKSADSVNEATHELLNYVKVALKNKIVDEEFFLATHEKICDDTNLIETASKIIILLEAGVSVQAITKVLVFSGFIEGAFTPDLGLLVTPIVEKMILTMGKAAKVEKIKLNRPKKSKV